MPVYIISTHGDPQWNAKTTVPAGVSVRFYQQFGRPMANNVGLVLQSALRNPQDARSPAVIGQYPQRALWNGPSNQTPEIDLSGDNHVFYSGIVHAESGTVIKAVAANETVTLTAALALIQADAANRNALANTNEEAVVHCLFCL
ncbi:putative adhesin [Allonocardiopsis opalescens]|uniref:Putative adhesin Stv domain-containing protein n=1 Tax=Allonocardiopsis opalescens TaxID=1144618 RepID=A0A2T0Q7H8_9ACTN|nr:hypothetical protein [Allonocardiopsis opalescens]PRX99777.1 hypothetical protein CLV72_103383 [Allonocardiopsis opalescens]